MARSKFMAIAASAAIAAMLGLSACGGQPASSSAASSAAASSATAASSAAASSAAASSAAASSAAASSAAAADDTIISWQGALVDGTLVDFISSDDGKNGGFVLSKNDNSEPMRWLGAMTTEGDKVTITDDTSKKSISFTRSADDSEGAITIEVEGYGKGAIVPMTAQDWQHVAEAEQLKEAPPDSSMAALVIGSVNSTDTKSWTGKVATKGDKVTITDDDSKESITITVSKVAEDGTLNIEADGYGKGVLVQMTLGDWMTIGTLAESSSTK